MARTDTLENFLTDVSTAIKSKTGKADTITPANFDTEITNITGGSSKYAPSFASFYRSPISDLSEDVAKLDTSNITSMIYMFGYLEKVKSLDLKTFNTSNVGTMQYMFSSSSELTSVDISTFNLTSLSDVKGMFNGCSNLTSVNFGTFNAGVRYCSTMFSGCKSITSINLENMKGPNVETCDSMFKSCEKAVSINLRNFNAGERYMNAAAGQGLTLVNMFYNCKALQYLDIRSMDFTNTSTSNYFLTNVPASCEIIVKNDIAKNFILSVRSDMTNVKTAAEKEAEA